MGLPHKALHIIDVNAFRQEDFAGVMMEIPTKKRCDSVKRDQNFVVVDFSPEASILTFLRGSPRAKQTTFPGNAPEYSAYPSMDIQP